MNRKAIIISISGLKLSRKEKYQNREEELWKGFCDFWSFGKRSSY